MLNMNRKTDRRSREMSRGLRRGFTLMEVIVVVTIIALLAALVAPRLLQNVGKAKTSAAKSECQSIAQQVNTYLLDMGMTRPSDDFELESLLMSPDDGGPSGGPYLQKRDDLIDPWGNPYIIRIPGDVNYDFDVVSMGEDGELNTDDDITN
jgi:general secretion pathway protein G